MPRVIGPSGTIERVYKCIVDYRSPWTPEPAGVKAAFPTVGHSRQGKLSDESHF